MNKKPAILLLVFCVVAVPAMTGFSVGVPRESLLWDGFVLTGVEGKLSPAVSQRGGEWLFEFDIDVNDLRVEAPAGTKLKLLPSLTLERLIADVNERSENTYRISGWVTKYKGANFIFPSYFLPISIRVKPQLPTEKETKKTTVSAPDDLLAMPQEIRDRLSDQRIARSRTAEQTPKTKEAENAGESTPETEGPAVGESNDLLAMPKEIRDRLSDRRIVRPRTPRRASKTEKIKIERDTILADRSALLVKRNDGQLLFVLNAFGRDVRPVSLRLLPCEALELAEFAQSAIPEPVRFKIAGIITKYKGEKYLLLQKAVRTYSHGNFAR